MRTLLHTALGIGAIVLVLRRPWPPPRPGFTFDGRSNVTYVDCKCRPYQSFGLLWTPASPAEPSATGLAGTN